MEHLKELKESGNEQKVLELIQEACCCEWKMRISMRQEYYKGENRIRYQIVRCAKIDFAAESKSIFKMLELY